MQKKTNEKILTNQIIDFRKQEMSYAEKCEVIEAYCELKNLNPNQFARQFNINPTQIYRVMQVKKFTPYVKKMVDKGVITESKAAEVIFCLKGEKTTPKDKNGQFSGDKKVLKAEKIDEAVFEVIQQKMPIDKVSRHISKKNNPGKEAFYLNTELRRITRQVDELKVEEVPKNQVWTLLKSLKCLRQVIDSTISRLG